MKQRRTWSPLRAVSAAMLLLAGLMTGRAEVEFSGLAIKPGSGVDIKVVSLFDSLPRAGFMPVEISIENRTSVPQTWTFTFRSPSFSKSGLSHPVEVQVGAGQSMKRPVFLPMGELQSARDGHFDMISCRVSGYGVQSGTILVSMKNKNNNGTGYVVMSSRIGKVNWSEVNERLEKENYVRKGLEGRADDLVRHRTPGGRSGSAYTLSGPVLDLRRLPADSRSWISVEALWLQPEDWHELDPAQQEVLVNWVWSGGQMYVALEEGSGEQGIGPWKFAVDGASANNFGAGWVKKVPLAKGKLDAGLTAAEVCQLFANAAAPASEDYDGGVWPLLQDIGQIRIPTAWIILSVLVFLILIGPVNLWWLAGSGRRHWIFISTPLLSLAMVLILGVAIVGYDGTGGEGRRMAMVLLSSGGRPAVVVQEQVSRCAFLLDRGFRVDSHTLLASIPVEDGRGLSNFERVEDRVRGDWFSSRAVKAQLLEFSLPSRAGVERSGEENTLISRIPVELENLYYMDEEGSWWKVDRMRTGESVKLQKSDKKEYEHWLEEGLKNASLNMKARMEVLAGRRGYFYAMGGGGGQDLPVPVETLPSIRWQEDRVLYLGPLGKKE